MFFLQDKIKHFFLKQGAFFYCLKVLFLQCGEKWAVRALLSAELFFMRHSDRVQRHIWDVSTHCRTHKLVQYLWGVCNMWYKMKFAHAIGPHPCKMWFFCKQNRTFLIFEVSVSCSLVCSKAYVLWHTFRVRPPGKVRLKVTFIWKRLILKENDMHLRKCNRLMFQRQKWGGKQIPNFDLELNKKLHI